MNLLNKMISDKLDQILDWQSTITSDGYTQEQLDFKLHQLRRELEYLEDANLKLQITRKAQVQDLQRSIDAKELRATELREELEELSYDILIDTHQLHSYKSEINN